jgi:serine O-acetyltransferase
VIQSKRDYLDYLEADRIALGRKRLTVLGRLRQRLCPDYIWAFQRLLRRVEYYGNVKRKGVANRLHYLFLKLRFRHLSMRLGFTIPENVFGPGLAIVHYGTIVVNERARIGANCRIHPGANIGASGGEDKAPRLGDNIYIAPGVKIFGDITIASNTAIGANAVVTKSFHDENTMLAGIPATSIKQIDIRRLIKHLDRAVGPAEMR